MQGAISLSGWTGRPGLEAGSMECRKSSSGSNYLFGNQIIILMLTTVVDSIRIQNSFDASRSGCFNQSTPFHISSLARSHISHYQAFTSSSRKHPTYSSARGSPVHPSNPTRPTAPQPPQIPELVTATTKEWDFHLYFFFFFLIIARFRCYKVYFALDTIREFVRFVENVT